MNKMNWTLGTLLVTLALSMATPGVAAETITPHQFAARCFSHGGTLTLGGDLVVGRGVVEMEGCRVDLRSFDLKFYGAHIRFTGDFIAQGARGSKVSVRESALVQSEHARGHLNILLFGSEVEIYRSQVHFLGNIHFVAHGDEGRVRVESSFVGTSGEDIFISASRDAGSEEGKINVARSRLFAQGTIFLATGRQGEINVHHGVMVAVSRDIHITAGAEGQIHIHDNDRAMEVAGHTSTGLFAGGAIRVDSGEDGETLVQENRMLAHVITLVSGGEIEVKENDFRGSASVVVRGRPCEAEDNRADVPVRCTR